MDRQVQNTRLGPIYVEDRKEKVIDEGDGRDWKRSKTVGEMNRWESALAVVLEMECGAYK